jgi:transcriptional regulator with XRE-family HTH domain
MRNLFGNALTERLRMKMLQDCLSQRELAKQLRVGASYLSQLTSGAKPISGVSELFLRSCAEYLELPPVLVYLLAGRLKAKDFFVSPESFEQHLNAALVQITNTRIGAETAVDAELLTRLPVSTKLLIVLLYERAENVLLLPARVCKGEVEVLGGIQVPFQVRLNKLRQ